MAIVRSTFGACFLSKTQKNKWAKQIHIGRHIYIKITSKHTVDIKNIFCAGVFLFSSTFASTILAQSTNAGDVWLLSTPRSFDNCVIKAMKDTQSNDTADAILHSCQNQFPLNLRNKKTQTPSSLASAAPDKLPLGKSKSYGAVGGSVVESAGGNHNTGFAGNMKFGYRFRPRFALELDILLLNDINTSDAFDKGGVVSMNGKVYLHNNLAVGKIRPYILAGAGWGGIDRDPPRYRAEWSDDSHWRWSRFCCSRHHQPLCRNIIL